MATNAERRAAREKMAAYHQVELAKLVGRVGQAVDEFRAGQLDAFAVDQVLYQYSRAAKELWKFCNLGSNEPSTFPFQDELSIDWWERGAPRRQ
ncbi:hypothetical protein [uncultured Serinicoccus sp.]|uniref:hypothetical protein n=1 Tax=uncultured Serinicoccus sp. TaxID=735514 RepID=UPI002616EE6C|nr:hypothetical protein [uncultured Serinicoccus sp.]